jgi:Arc/MetJ family transcription regulator
MIRKTSIVLDDELVAKAMQATGIRTRRELVSHALQELLRHEGQAKLLALKGKVHWEGDLNKSRYS